MDIGIAALVAEAYSGNPQAIHELNDILADFDIKPLTPRKLYVVSCSMDDGYALFYGEYPDLQEESRKFSIQEIEDSDDLYSFLGLGWWMHQNYPNEAPDLDWDNWPDGTKVWLEKANFWYDICVKYHIPIIKRDCPIAFDAFENLDMEVFGFVEFMKKICKLPVEEWYWDIDDE